MTQNTEEHYTPDEFEKIIRESRKPWTQEEMNSKFRTDRHAGIIYRRQGEDSYIVLLSGNPQEHYSSVKDKVIKACVLTTKESYFNFRSDDGKVFFYSKSDNERGNKRLREALEGHVPVFLMENVSKPRQRKTYKLLGRVRPISNVLMVTEKHGYFPMMLESDYRNAYEEGTLEGYIKGAEELINSIVSAIRSTEDIPEAKGHKIATSDFLAYLINNKLIFDYKTVRRFIISLETRPFVILAGVSGCGKTRLVQAYAEYLSNGKGYKSYELIAVGSNWNENRYLIGYNNILKNEYVETKTVELLRRTYEDPDNLYVLILDEMNLSPVEYYFSDFLSAMESGEKIIVDPITKKDLRFPENLLVIGTVNVDETTRSFSPKVIDRAFVIRFENVDIGRALGEQPVTAPTNEHDIIPITEVSRLADIRGKGAATLLENMTSAGVDMSTFTERLKIIHKGMSNLGSFGYRTVDDIVRYTYISWNHAGCPTNYNPLDDLDSAVLMKVIPKIHGGTEITKSLEYLAGECNELLDSKNRIDDMSERLKIDRYVSFID